MEFIPILAIPLAMIAAGIMLTKRHRRNNPTPPVKTIVTIFGYSPELVKNPGGPIKRIGSIVWFFSLIAAAIAVKVLIMNIRF